MALLDFNGSQIYYELTEGEGPLLVFVNGLTQATRHWQQYQEYFSTRGYRVLTYDLLGQGESSKPVLDVNFDQNSEVLLALLDHLDVEKAFIAGISFGGIIVLKFGIRHPERVAGLIPMSTFSEMDAQLRCIGANLYQGMSRVGFEYLIDLFTSYNFSAEWIARHQDAMPGLKRASSGLNDLYAIQNLMESIAEFEDFTDELGAISAPTLIMNGEHDALTPRRCHEVLRQGIANSRLLLLQHVCHAFTLEIPEITCRAIEDFMIEVNDGAWRGDQSVWIAATDPKADAFLLSCRGDHTRCVPV